MYTKLSHIRPTVMSDLFFTLSLFTDCLYSNNSIMQICSKRKFLNFLTLYQMLCLWKEKTAQTLFTSSHWRSRAYLVSSMPKAIQITDKKTVQMPHSPCQHRKLRTPQASEADNSAWNRHRSTLKVLLVLHVNETFRPFLTLKDSQSNLLVIFLHFLHKHAGF